MLNRTFVARNHQSICIETYSYAVRVSGEVKVEVELAFISVIEIKR